MIIPVVSITKKQNQRIQDKIIKGMNPNFIFDK
jgi:hypothetical protein